MLDCGRNNANKIIGNRLALVAEESVSGGHGGGRRRVNSGAPIHAHLYHRQRGNHACAARQPATVNDGEVAVASNEELHACPRSAPKRLLALWNALPGVEKAKEKLATAMR